MNNTILLKFVLYILFQILSVIIVLWKFMLLMPTNCLSVFDHFVGLLLKGLPSMHVVEKMAKHLDDFVAVHLSELTMISHYLES